MLYIDAVLSCIIQRHTRIQDNTMYYRMNIIQGIRITQLGMLGYTPIDYAEVLKGFQKNADHVSKQKRKQAKI